MSHIDDIIRERIRIAIAESGLSQAKVADKADISVVNLNRVINAGRQGVSPETIHKICKALNIPVAFIFGEINEYERSDGTKLNFSPTPQRKLSYGELLRNLLDAKGLTQTEAAELIKMDRKIFNNYVRGKREPNMQMWQRISTALSVPVGYFFNEITLEDALKHNEPTPERLEKLNKLH